MRRGQKEKPVKTGRAHSNLIGRVIVLEKSALKGRTGLKNSEIGLIGFGKYQAGREKKKIDGTRGSTFRTPEITSVTYVQAAGIVG